MDVDGTTNGLLINKEDVERQRNHLLNAQYNVDMVDISKYHYLSANDLNTFIEFTVNSIAETIFQWLKKNDNR